MNELEGSPFLLRSHDGDSWPALTGVEARGQLDGVLLSMTLRQTYRNAGARPLEVIYTFPLPHGAVLLGLAAEFDGHRMVGRVMLADTAEQTYERALEDGHAPVLLEHTCDGLYTANLGNLKPGETVTLEVRFAQLIAFDQGRLRLAIPTTIAPRYGHAKRAGLQPHQVPGASLNVEYPLALSLLIAGSLARGRIDCPTHAHRLEEVAGGMELQLLPGARLDRDLVVIVNPAEPMPGLLLVGGDPDGGRATNVALAAFAVPKRSGDRAICARLLVDCSGSMAGDSMASARTALQGALAALGEQDEASLTRFGSRVRHAVAAGLCSPQHRQRLLEGIEETDATMGGTELHEALMSVFVAWPRKELRVDVLLITDGEVWQYDELVHAARRSGHRVFAIGVGSAPAVSVLRRIAEATGGAAEFATPGEAVAQAAQRMLQRMRQAPANGLTVDWGAEPVWQLPMAAGAFGGDTVLAMAGFPQRMALQTARLSCLDVEGAHTELTRTAVVADVKSRDLARIAAAQRIANGAVPDGPTLDLAYELLTPRTRLVLVHERPDTERVSEPGSVQRVPGMLAAGWGGTSRIQLRPNVAFGALPPDMRMAEAVMAPRSEEVRAIRSVMGGVLFKHGIKQRPFDVAASQAAPVPARRVDPLHLLMAQVASVLQEGGTRDDLVVKAQDWEVPESVAVALKELDHLGIGRPTAWLLFALWVAARSERAWQVRNQAASLLSHWADIDPSETSAGLEVFERTLKPPLLGHSIEGAMRRLLQQIERN